MRENAYIGYRCSVCGAAVIYEISIFSLSGAEASLRCSCRETALSARYNKSTGQVMLRVPCVACPRPHPYQIAATTLFSEKLLILPCSSSGLDILFVGDKAKVARELERSGKELEQMIEEMQGDWDPEEYGEDRDDDGGGADRRERGVYDEVVVNQIGFILKELLLENKIRCGCAKPSLNLRLDYDRILLKCPRCGRGAQIAAKTDGDCIRLAQTEQIILK